MLRTSSQNNNKLHSSNLRSSDQNLLLGSIKKLINQTAGKSSLDFLNFEDERSGKPLGPKRNVASPTSNSSSPGGSRKNFLSKVNTLF